MMADASASSQPALPDCIAYWTRGKAVVNFGDYLSELLFAELFREPAHYADARIHLIGSVISPDWIQQSLAAGYRHCVFWGCGLRRAAALPQPYRQHAVFLGVRGPLSRKWLELPAGATPIGDPALLLPSVLLSPRDGTIAGRTICVPHFSDRTDEETLRRETGAELVVRPNIRPDLGECRKFVAVVASAQFVLAGALHAAIVAHAYGVPYAFYAARRIDVPFKWRDFAASVGRECRFAGSVSQGMSLERESRGARSVCSLSGLLAVAPFPVREMLR